jgi:hypothetical protein
LEKLYLEVENLDSISIISLFCAGEIMN